MYKSHQKTTHHNIQVLANINQHHCAALIKDNPTLHHNSSRLASILSTGLVKIACFSITSSTQKAQLLGHLI